MKNNGFRRLINSKPVTLLISFVVAVILWSVVVTYISNDVTTRIKDVTINFNYNKLSYQNLGLEIIEADVEKVDVVVSGPRSVVGALTADDVIVYPNFASVSDSGKYSLQLTWAKTSNIKEFTVDSLSRQQAVIRFDRLVEKTFNIDIDVSALVIPGDYMVDKIVTSPETMTIQGPEKTMESIAKVVATIETAETLTQSAVLPAAIKIYDGNGALVDTTYLKMDAETVNITVPVLKEIDLPIKVEYINVPQGFDTDTLHMSLSHRTIRLAVPSKIAANLTEFVAGYIDLQTMETDKAYLFDIKTPSGYKNMNELTQISATISTGNLVTRTVAVSEIKVLNKGQQNVEVLTQIINNVFIVGEKEVVEALSSGSIIAQIDMSRVALAQGQQTVAVEIIIPSTDKAYAKGTYSATIKN